MNLLRLLRSNSLEKNRLYAGTPVYLAVLVYIGVLLYTHNMSDNLTSADNQQETVNFTQFMGSSETTRRTPTSKIYKAYLLGSLHDGTYNSLHNTFRISQANKLWLTNLQKMLLKLGYKSWIYKEGKNRSVYVLETTAAFLDINFNPLLLHSKNEQLAYVRGYFDAEGGIPRSIKAKFYIQLCQKNRTKIEIIKSILKKSGINCGKIHNPSKAVDPNYWRVYIRADSHLAVMLKVSSWHPRKRLIFKKRMMI